MVPTIAVINEAKTPLPNGIKLQALVNAAQAYINNHLRIDWNFQANLVVQTKIPVNAWSIVLLDDADVANALGYHDLTPNGLPYGRVFVKTAMDAGEDPCVTFTHELGEMAVDPQCEQLVMNLNDGRIYPKEIADPVEETSFKIQGINVSNYVRPPWFQSWRTGVQFDYLGVLKAPFTLAAGGYASVIQNGQFTDIFGQDPSKPARFAQEQRAGHRVERWKQRVASKVPWILKPDVVENQKKKPPLKHVNPKHLMK